VRYVLAQPVIRSLILLVGGLTLLGMSFGTLIPAWAAQILGGDARTNGWLMSARGVGALMGALTLASLGRFKFKGRLLTLGMFVFPVMVLIYAFVRWLPLALLVLAGAGVSNILVLNLANALVQTQISDNLRGRVMGIYTWVFFGAMPLGGLLVGAVAQRIGAPLTVIGGALASLGVAVLVWMAAPQVRRLE
jgi:MFS family permease